MTIAGRDTLRPIADAVAGPCVALRRKGSDDAINAMAAGIGQVALLDRAAWEQERRPFRVAHGGSRPRSASAITASLAVRTHPTAVFVNRQPDRFGRSGPARADFHARSRRGRIPRWIQGGVSGPADARRIHAYGTRDTGDFATNIRI